MTSIPFRRVRINMAKGMRIVILLSLLFLFKSALPQMTFRVTAVPHYFTPVLDTIFIAGNFNGWTPGDTNYMLTPEGDDLVISFSGIEGDTLEFKFTRGDWARVETQADGSFLPNRQEAMADGTEKTYTIADWDDTNGSHTISGNVFELDYNFYMPQFDRTRRIWIYLPPDYYTSSFDYPVVYMHDGQNVFDYASSFAGEWDADGTMETLIAGGHTKAILVGVANGEMYRIDEYTPWEHDTYGGGDGEQHAKFMAETLKPYIDSNYRTLPDREHTVIGGSSLGGLLSYYMALEYDSVFGKAIIFSPSFWFNDSVHVFTDAFEKTLSSKLYFSAGLYEDGDMVPDMEEIYADMEAAGFTADEYISVIRADGAHSEWFWKRELDDALLWLFEGEMPTPVMHESEKPMVVYDSVNQQVVTLSEELLTYCVFDLQGKNIWQGQLSGEPLSLQSLPAGMYIFTYNTPTHYNTLKCTVH